MKNTLKHITMMAGLGTLAGRIAAGCGTVRGGCESAPYRVARAGGKFEVRELAAGRFAVLRYSGRRNVKNEAESLERWRAWMKAEGVVAASLWLLRPAFGTKALQAGELSLPAVQGILHGGGAHLRMGMVCDWDKVDTNWVAMYWKTWELAFRNFHEPAPGSGYVSQFIDAAFNQNIFQWDTCFMTLFCNHAHPLVPGIGSLDNFYRKQYPDGGYRA